MNIFDPDSKFSQIMGIVFDYAKLGLLTLILCVPVITAGAGITAAMSVGMKIARNEAPTLWKPFWSSFRENFRQSIILMLICVLYFGILGMDWRYVMQQESTGIIRVTRAGIFLAAALGGMVALYFFPILARYRLTTRQIIRNSAVYALINFPRNLLAIGILIFGILLMGWAVPLLPVIVLALPAVLIRYMSVVCVRSFSKSEARARGEDNGEQTV